MTHSKKSILTIWFIILISLNSQTFSVELNIDQIDSFLTKSEQNFTDIVEGTEKKVRWYQGQRKKTQYAIIYLHGFSATSQELSPTTEILADKLKANVYYPRLTGHGRSDDAMGESSLDAWKKDTLEAYQIAEILGNRIIIISTSTGGTLATWLLSELSQSNITKPFANIMVSPNYGIRNSSAWLLKSWLGFKIAKLINGNYNSFEPHSPEHAKYWTERYPIEAIRPMLALLDEINELDKSQITTSQLLIFSPQDKVVNVDKIKNVSKEFTSSKTSLLEFNESTDPYQHVLSGVACSEESTEKMVHHMLSYISLLTNE